MKLNCKVWPVKDPHAAFPDEKFDWACVVNIKVIYKHSITKWFEGWVDTGSPWCLFHADMCRPLGMKLEDGIRSELGGIVRDPQPKFTSTK